MAGCPILISIASLTSNTIRSMLVHPKDKTPDAQKCGLVYQVECPECSLTYIGETGRMLATRMKDHLNLRNPLTAVGEHCAHEHHTITKDSVRVLAREDGWFKRKVREAIEIVHIIIVHIYI